LHRHIDLRILTCATKSGNGDKQAIYIALSLDNPPPQLTQLTTLRDSITKIQDLLKVTYADSKHWARPELTNYIISDELIPTFSQMQNVTVKVTNVAFKTDATGSVTLDLQAAGTAAFSVRKYTPLAPEIGVGAVFGTLKQPQYGTATNAAGQMTVAKASQTSLSVNPSVLANFVCRCGGGFLLPMLQIGAATSKDLPAVLVGAGIRLFGLGKGDVAIGGGAMFGWYKDLQKLKVGDVVTGTKDITADLGYISTPKIGGYFAIQYKF
jgi:hypothetical protein